MYERKRSETTTQVRWIAPLGHPSCLHGLKLLGAEARARGVCELGVPRETARETDRSSLVCVVLICLCVSFTLFELLHTVSLYQSVAYIA